jgi:serine/threonine protein kinase
MAKIYGDRWRTDRALDSGGQGDVFTVFDLTGESPDLSALKRIRNPKRRKRFETEVLAIKRLTHPNIIKLLDHSALDIPGDDERQYLVMPLAQCALPKRVPFLKDSLDSVMRIAFQLAGALEVAHAAGVIHRDVKPGNVLFADDGPNVWLSDFGICLLRDEERHTPEDEVMGPRSFLAPELEHGGQLDVSGSADVYSLGKLIYYMLSGGVVLPREELANERYANLFSKGRRFLHLQVLLARMICPLGLRIQEMSEVKQRLQELAEWDSREPSVISQSGLQVVDRIKVALLNRKTIAEANKEARASEQQNLAFVLESAREWLKEQLDLVSSALAVTDLVSSSAAKIDFANDKIHWTVHLTPSAQLRPVMGYEVSYETPDNRIVSLALYVCTKKTVRVIEQSSARPLEDLEVRLIPKLCARTRFGDRHETFILSDSARANNAVPYTDRYISDAIILQARTTLSQWLATTNEWSRVLTSAVEVFFSEIEKTTKGR